MTESQGATNNKLGDLHPSQGSLERIRDPYLQARQREIKVHQRVNKGVEDDKDPDRRRLEPDTAPHAHHGARVVVALQKRRWPALQQDDRRVQHFVELRQVEPEAEQL